MAVGGLVVRTAKWLAPCLVALCISACGDSGSRTCGPANCAGCCDSSGGCRLGTESEACGLVGATCLACGAQQICSGGACISAGVNPTGGDGGAHTDGGIADGGADDAGSMGDGGTTDGGTNDGGGSDAGSSDGGTSDAGSPDAGCPASTHDCSGTCVADDSVDHCGTLCSPCATSSHATAACVAGQCQLTCDPGFLRCGSGCCGVVQVAGSAGHGCALTTANGVRCWGANYAGQLGDGTQTNRIHPVDVQGLTSGVKQLAAGGAHTCALKLDGTLWCWGSNSAGQLGDGTTTDRLVPTQVPALGGTPTAISAGYEYTCALFGTSGFRCWGRNSNGELGNGTFVDKTSPGTLVALTNPGTDIACSSRTACLRKQGTGLACWGRNFSGQVGNGNTTDQPSPTPVTAVGGAVSQVSVGAEHVCAVSSTGQLSCWGADDCYQLGPTTPLTGIAQVAAGDSQTCVLTTSGGVKCFGCGTEGQLGANYSGDTPNPVDVVGLSSGVQALFGFYARRTCAIKTTGELLCWGENSAFGELGDGTSTSAFAPVDVIDP